MYSSCIAGVVFAWQQDCHESPLRDKTNQFATRAAVISDSHPSGITNAVINSTAWDVLNDPEGLKIIIAHVHSKYGSDWLSSLCSAFIRRLNCDRILGGCMCCLLMPQGHTSWHTQRTFDVNYKNTLKVNIWRVFFLLIKSRLRNNKLHHTVCDYSDSAAVCVFVKRR